MDRRKQDKPSRRVGLASTARAAQKRLRSFGDSEVATILARFFKTAPGQYAEGDRFIGVKVPTTRKIAREFKRLPLGEVDCLLHSDIHEERLMLNLIISPELEAKIPGIAVGWITATVHVAEHDADLWREIDAAAQRYRGMTMEQARKFPAIKALRDAYKSLGNDPTRYRGANEALVRRITQGKELYRVNTVVDINNLVTLETLYTGGAYDLDRIQPPITFRIGQQDEAYSGIGRGEIKLAGLPVFGDHLGPFGCTTSDSERAMIRLATTRLLMVLISFNGSDGLGEAVQRAVGLFERYAGATEVETGVARGETVCVENRQ